MKEDVSPTSHRILFFNTAAFTICFAAWMLNGVLVTFLVQNQLFDWGPVEIGWLIGLPVLAGSLFRLPAGMLTDRYGGRPVYTVLLLLSAVPMFLLSYAQTFVGFALASLGFGLTGASFAVGIAFTSVWYPKEWQGTALGIFGAGNAGAALTTLAAPSLLNWLTADGANLEAWRHLPRLYAAVLLATALLFFVFTENRKPEASGLSLRGLLAPLTQVRVWRFGLYYFLVFGCFVAFSQWLVPYFVSGYYLPLVTAGFLAALFSFPSGVIRAAGGWMSDRWGARRVMFGVLGASVVISLLLSVPKMEITSPGPGVMSQTDGTVTSVTDTSIVVNGDSYTLLPRTGRLDEVDDQTLILPKKEIWQEAAVEPGDQVARKQLLARGVTRIYFQANVWIFVSLVILIGIVWGIGKAAVYKYIPDYFPEQVGVVGGMVGVLGGLGGFFCPIVFGYLLDGTGLWTSSWMFIFVLSLACLVWLHRTVSNMMREESEHLARHIER
ncbi:MAG: MFS transporter [Rhodothermales bacterium]